MNEKLTKSLSDHSKEGLKFFRESQAEIVQHRRDLDYFIESFEEGNDILENKEFTDNILLNGIV